MTLEAFEPCIGQNFSIAPDEATSFPVKLAAAAALPAARWVRPSQPFQLQFRSAGDSAATFLTQRIYAVEHERLGRVDMVLVPLGPPRDGSGGFLYQAVLH